jgi:hypothetical protein
VRLLLGSDRGRSIRFYGWIVHLELATCVRVCYVRYLMKRQLSFSKLVTSAHVDGDVFFVFLIIRVPYVFVYSCLMVRLKGGKI